ncbi:unnamed protein product [Sphenostylis stenocarpa]|uniref:Uncharacterized protein n=1 Tax=Sphenostylis stenocarpa TaxID=92480 RepID=A0AA86RST2_9FABA|nr:unnamed protein product [Sphenostylis stenocarpa]
MRSQNVATKFTEILLCIRRRTFRCDPQLLMEDLVSTVNFSLELRRSFSSQGKRILLELVFYAWVVLDK